ncbi:MAG TPA: pyruvate carboxylase subunit B [Candidatus Dormibacteraeota bacterium]|jgi:pyruvate carboxylase subunit B|nr:pyruvate carboxylase subunit B [Candidatus Dormibacteraeota bacterium]
MPRLELVETSLRHGQQSLMVSRLRLRHALPVAETLDHCGFAALDVFGGSTFEASLRFLAEDPFERLRAIRAAAPITPLLALIGGQSLVGHRQVPDDLVDAFIDTSAAAGVDIFRCYDPLNDVRNLERCATAIAATGKQAEGVIVYNEVPGRGPDGLGDVARRLVDAGYPTICLHDPLGVLGAAAASRAVKVIREAAGVPVAVSISAQTGMAALACHSAALAGAYRADCALSPLAGGASMPGAEALVAGFAGTDVDSGLDLERIAAAALILEHELLHYADVIDPLAARLDTSALRGLLPPSAMGHAMAELRERSSMARLAEVEADVVQVRTELGYPPLITPLTEIMATQAVYNVVEGDRYATVSQEIKDYCLGLYGEPPEPVDREVRRLVNGREEPITCRPADLLEPVMESTRRELIREGHATPDLSAMVTYALFPNAYLNLVRGDAVAERLGDEPDLEPAAGTLESAPVGDIDAGEPQGEEPPALPVRELTVEVDGQSYAVRIIGGVDSGGPTAVEPPAAQDITVREGTVVSPMQGLLLKVNVKVGDRVALGDVVCVLEAMKMQNDITATRAGTVTEVYVTEGIVVSPRAPLIQIGA